MSFLDRQAIPVELLEYYGKHRSKEVEKYNFKGHWVINCGFRVRGVGA